MQLWNDRLGSVLRDETQQVQDAYLLVSGLNDLKNILKDFNAQDIKDEDYIRLLRYCRNDSLKECFASWRVLAGGGLKRVSLVSSWNREELIKYLREVPCWWTGTGAARALADARPLLFTRPEDWPDWLPADSLYPRMRKVLKLWETRAKKLDKDEILEIWRELISGRLLKQREEYLHDVLLPFVAKWDDERWEADGWRALRQVLSWSINRKFESVAPWVENTDGNQEEKRRAQAARMLRIPTDKGWLLASNCYAGKDWDGPLTFDRFFVSVKARGLVRPFQRWPNRIRKGTDKGQWKALLRWAGVSWEPKARRVVGLPDHCLVEIYEKESFYEWLYDWQIEFFPECIHNTNDGNDPASVIRTMLPLADAVKKYRATFYRTYYYRRKKEKNYNKANFADCQLRHEEWLPCEPALFHAGRRVAPCNAFLPGEGLRGLLPEVDKSGVGNEEWFQRIKYKLRSLGVREQLPEDPTDWHEWMRKLSKLAEQLEESERKVPERGEETGGLYRAADALYRGYLKLEWENDGEEAGTLYRGYLELERRNEFPEDIDIPCLAWEDDRETLMFSPPSEVYYVGESHFDEVRQDILRKGYKLFIVRLDAGNSAPERLGVGRLSDTLSAEPQYDEPAEPESQKLLQSYSERCRGLSVAASLTKSLPKKLNIIAVNRLRLKLTANGKPVPAVQVLSWRREDGALLINLNKDKWRALGHGLAARVADAEDKASLFENLLRESDKEGYLDRLRQEGVTEDDIREAENAWLLGAPLGQGTDNDLPLPQGPKLGIGPSQGVAPDSQNPQRETQQPPQPETGAGGGMRPPRTPTSSNGASRPRPETGLAAEDWLYEKLKRVFSQVERHVRDDENRERDFVISSGRRRFHIEVKHTASRPGMFHWSGLQCEKARDFEGKSDDYVMAILFPNGEQDYEIRWIWRPLDELRKASREVQWAGNSGYDPVSIDSWDVSERRPLNVPTRRYEFRIKLNDETLEAFQRDTETLEALHNKING